MESINSFLPKPKHETEYSSNSGHNKGDGITIVSNLGAEERQLLSKTYSIPPYGSRGVPNKWRPRDPEDYGDGGAYPEIHVAQYPRNMGSPAGSRGKGGAGPVSRQNKTLALTVTSEGQVDYTSIARQGHAKNRVIQSSFQDLVPLRQRAKNGEISLDRPEREEVDETRNKTQLALQKIVDNQVAASKPKTAINSGPASQANATYVRYTPTNMMGESSDVAHKQRIIKIVDVQEDPLAPPKFKHSKVPARPPSPPAPVLRSPPRKLTAEDQKNWYIPPSVSNWKNQKGFTIAIDKRMAADGRHLQEHTINDNFAKLSESLAIADNKMRQEVQHRNQQRRLMKEKEELDRESKLKELARKAKEERDEILKKTSSVNSRRRYSDSESEGSDIETEDKRKVSIKRERSPQNKPSPSPPPRRRRRGDSASPPVDRSPLPDRSRRARRGSYASVSRSPSPEPRRRRRGSSVSPEPSRSPIPDRRPYDKKRRGSVSESEDEGRGRSRSPSDNESPPRKTRRRGSYEREPPRRNRRRGSYSEDESPRPSRNSRRRGSYSDQSEDDSDHSRNRSSHRDERRANKRDDRDRETPDERRRRIERAERLQEERRKLRVSRMGTERRVKSMLGDGDRDISERVALGVAKPTATSSSDTQFDSRLMGRVSVSNTINEDNVYDSALFRASEAAASIYRPKGNKSAGGDDDEDEMGDRMNKESRFEALGSAKNGFAGAQNAEERTGPVEFEKDDGRSAVDQMFKEIKESKENVESKGKDKKKSSRWK